MKFTRRKTWILLFVFCLLIWGLLIDSLVHASETSDDEKSHRELAQHEVIIQKIKQLDLSPEQSAFLETLASTASDSKNDSDNKN